MNEPTFICTRCHGEAPMSERLPSPVTLLRGISEGEIKVDYILIK